jgi:hypothetical protein
MLGGFPSDRVFKGVSYKDLLVGSLPENVLSHLPRSFDIVGDIALIRLDDDLIIYGGGGDRCGDYEDPQYTPYRG